MARIIHTATADLQSFNPDQRLWIYNGLDCAATLGIAQVICPEAEEKAGPSYKFVRAMCGPALDMMLRGIAVQPIVRRNEINRLTHERTTLQARLNALAHAVWGRDLSPDSPKQMLAFFYGALGMPVQYAIRKTPEGRKRTPSCDHGALEALSKLTSKGPGVSPWSRQHETVHFARPFVTLVLKMRETKKLLDVVKARTRNNRWHSSYNPVGTVSARWSSSADAFDDGLNLQNVTERMRRAACADDGRKLGAPDLEQAESRMVAALAWSVTGDDKYWMACESGDLHTVVSTMSYPERFHPDDRWNDHANCFGGDLKRAREVADAKWYRHLSLRDGNKRIGHGTNYWGSPMGIAGMIGDIEPKIVSEFQSRYFRAFPAIRHWHSATIFTIQTTHKLTTPMLRTNHFFGRVYDDSTLREAMAYVPQSALGELLNLMLYRVWEYGVRGGTIQVRGRDIPFRQACHLHLQVHDSIVFSYPDDPEVEAAVVAKVEDLMTIPLPIRRPATGEIRYLSIPLEFKIGWNWMRNDPKKEISTDGNPDGLIKWKGPGADTRKRLQCASPSPAEWLD